MTEKNKISLPSVSAAIERTIEAREDGTYDDAELVEVMGDLLVDLESAVDRRIAFLDYLGKRADAKNPGSGVIGTAESLYRAYREKCERAEKLKERVQEMTLYTVETHAGVTFKGKLGKLASQTNGQARLIIDLQLASKTFSNLINTESPEFFEIPANHLKAVTVMQLDTDAIRADLAAGKELSFARTEKGTHLRVRR